MKDNWYEKFLEEGKANKEGFSEKDADPNQLAIGIKIEKEHTDDETIARKIAIDHLSEDSLYYTHLKEMEKKYKK